MGRLCGSYSGNAWKEPMAAPAVKSLELRWLGLPWPLGRPGQTRLVLFVSFSFFFFSPSIFTPSFCVCPQFLISFFWTFDVFLSESICSSPFVCMFHFHTIAVHPTLISIPADEIDPFRSLCGPLTPLFPDYLLSHVQRGGGRWCSNGGKPWPCVKHRVETMMYILGTVDHVLPCVRKVSTEKSSERRKPDFCFLRASIAPQF